MIDGNGHKVTGAGNGAGVTLSERLAATTITLVIAKVYLARRTSKTRQQT